MSSSSSSKMVNKQELKRKLPERSGNYFVEDYDYDNDDDYGIETIDSDSNSSESVSSCASDGSSASFKLKKNKIKHGHKILITEEKMADAMSDLHMEDVSEPYSPKKHSFIECKIEPDSNRYIVEEDEADGDETSNDFMLSAELKRSLRDNKDKIREILLNNCCSDTNSILEHVITPIPPTVNNLQLIPWEPKPILVKQQEQEEISCIVNDESSSDSEKTSPAQSPNSTITETTSSCSNEGLNYYRVEEPSDLVKKERNKLKRSHSQACKLPIQEVFNTAEPFSMPGARDSVSSCYYVDEANDEDTLKANLVNLDASSSSKCNICEVFDAKNEEETMEF